ncbi:MAG: efflux RND transporter periplasmic adaptor subunit [Gemmatimonadales bacterium]|nr:efflux RND transporter periplasmic adaptor subunit [Gemmatimonadales bacterium]
MTTKYSLHWTLLLTVLSGAACASDGEKPDSAAIPSDSAANGRVTLTQAQATNAGITLAAVEERAAGGLLEATAEIEPAPARFAQIGARVAGRVVRLFVAEGDRVTTDQTMATVDSPELSQSTGDYLAAATTATVTREIADRERALFERKISSEREWRLAEAEAVRARAAKEAAENRLHALGLSDAELRQLQVEGHFASEVSIRTPLAGIVASRAISIGKIVQPGEQLFEVVDLAEVAIAIDVYEQNLTRVKVGQRVEAHTTSTGGQTFIGRVTSVGAVVERQSRTVKVRVILPNPDRVLRPGMFATVRVLGAGPDQQTGRAIYVPSSAIQRDGPTAIVFVSGGDPLTFVRREIDLGPESGGFTLVRRGLAVGERVAVTGALVLKAEMKKGTLGEPE